MDYKRTATNILAFSLFSTIATIGNTQVVNGEGNLEAEFVSMTKDYKSEDVIVENGISIKKNETYRLPQEEGWDMSNDRVVSIDDGIVYPINEGTVFLRKEIDDKIHVLEIYVSGKEARFFSLHRSNSVDRNYYKVFIDPGHGGKDNGASGFGNLEDEINLQISNKVAQILRSKNIEVKLSRESDVYLSLGERANLANKYGGDVFISIHQNASENSTANGIETYYHNNKVGEKSYSSKIQDNTISETKGKDRGVKSANFAVLREANMPSSLFEGGFLSNEEESLKLASEEYQNKIATGIAKGIEEYLKENIKLNNSNDNENGDDDQINPPPQQNKVLGEVIATSLNVRSGYGTSYGVVDKLKKGDKVEIIESENGWHKIKYSNKNGYVSGQYIKIESDSEPTLPEVTPPPQENKVLGEVTVSSLNVRSGYGTSYGIVDKLKKGDKVEIIESKNGWHKIKYSNKNGYVSGQYIKIESDSKPTQPEVTPPPQENKVLGEVAAGSLNVRSGYGTNYGIIGSLKRGQKVEIVESKNGWHKIKYNNTYGYVSGQYIKVEGDSKPTTPEVTPPPQESKVLGEVTASSLNVRSGYGTNYSVIGSLKRGQKVEIVESKNGWHKIKYNNRYGYVAGQYINK